MFNGFPPVLAGVALPPVEVPSKLLHQHNLKVPLEMGYLPLPPSSMPICTREQREDLVLESNNPKALESGCRGVVPSRIKTAPRGFYSDFGSLCEMFDGDCAGLYVLMKGGNLLQN